MNCIEEFLANFVSKTSPGEKCSMGRFLAVTAPFHLPPIAKVIAQVGSDLNIVFYKH
jgi:hypothetical protein